MLTAASHNNCSDKFWCHCLDFNYKGRQKNDEALVLSIKACLMPWYKMCIQVIFSTQFTTTIKWFSYAILFTVSSAEKRYHTAKFHSLISH